MSEEVKTEEGVEEEASSNTNQAPPSLLSRSTDQAARPGFRDPANLKSKAQKKKRKKKKR